MSHEREKDEHWQPRRVHTVNIVVSNISAPGTYKHPAENIGTIPQTSPRRGNEGFNNSTPSNLLREKLSRPKKKWKIPARLQNKKKHQWAASLSNRCKHEKFHINIWV